jgi:hypothetical protein
VTLIDGFWLKLVQVWLIALSPTPISQTQCSQRAETLRLD